MLALSGFFDRGSFTPDLLSKITSGRTKVKFVYNSTHGFALAHGKARIHPVPLEDLVEAFKANNAGELKDHPSKDSVDEKIIEKKERPHSSVNSASVSRNYDLFADLELESEYESLLEPLRQTRERVLRSANKVVKHDDIGCLATDIQLLKNEITTNKNDVREIKYRLQLLFDRFVPVTRPRPHTRHTYVPRDESDPSIDAALVDILGSLENKAPTVEQTDPREIDNEAAHDVDEDCQDADTEHNRDCEAKTSTRRTSRRRKRQEEEKEEGEEEDLHRNDQAVVDEDSQMFLGPPLKKKPRVDPVQRE